MDKCISGKINNCFKQLTKIGALLNEPMCKHTSFRIGGKADILVSPRNENELLYCLNCSLENDVPVFVMGNGTNLLVSDKGIRGIVIKLRSAEPHIVFDKDKFIMTVSADTLLCYAAKKSIEEGFMGLEWAAGVPGTIGGAISMNAGAYGGEIKQNILSVRMIEKNNNSYIIKDCHIQDNDLGYRYSRFSFPNSIITQAVFKLAPDDGNAYSRMKDFEERRISKQPLDLPSAGSTFKRPQNAYAGAEIERAGLKGFSYGGASVSEKHAGFIVNSNNATFDDVINLIQIVKQRVYENSGIKLTEEIKIIGG